MTNVIVPADKASNNIMFVCLYQRECLKKDLWLARISSLSNKVGLYVVFPEVLLFMP
jgi:hypothetical protein